MQIALLLLQLAPQFMKLGGDLYKQWNVVMDDLKRMQEEGNRDPSPEEWDRATALVEGLRAKLHRPD